MKYTTDIKIEFELEIIIPLAPWKRIMAYTDIAEGEIQGWADLDYDAEKKQLIVGEVYLLEQEASGGHVLIDEETQSKFNLECAKKGLKQTPRLWWHSHVNMETFFSGIDENNLKEHQNDTFIVALVVNKKREYHAKAYIKMVSFNGLFGENGEVIEKQEWLEVDPLSTRIQYEDEKINAELIKEVEEKVHKPKPHKIVPWQGLWEKGGRFIKPGDDDYGKDDEVVSYRHRIKTRLNHPNRLPKAPSEALEKVDLLGLDREWSIELQEWVYRDPLTDRVWLDFWEALDDADFDGDKLKKN